MPEDHPVLGRSEGDAVLATLGARRLALPVPFAAAGGPVNAYLLDDPDGSLTLLDTGVRSDLSLAALEQGFAEAGRRVEEVARVLVSHGHVDHFGLARWVQERSGARVFVHPADWNKVLVGRGLAPMRDYFARLGMPEAIVEGIARQYVKTEDYGARLDEVEPLEHGQRLRFARFEGEILHFPGHTPGLVCLHVPERRILFTDDHLLARVSPNPLLELGEGGEEGAHKALVAYLASARRLHDMDLDWLMPGHGEPFRGHRRTLESLFGFYERRQRRIVEALRAEPKTAYALVADVFGEAGVLQMFLMLSEIVGNLEVLEEQGRVARELVSGQYLWRATEP